MNERMGELVVDDADNVLLTQNLQNENHALHQLLLARRCYGSVAINSVNKKFTYRRDSARCGCSSPQPKSII